MFNIYVDLIQFYVTCIRPVIEYACEAFHDSLPQYLSNDLERLQKHALCIIFPELHYQEGLESFNILSLHDRRVKLTTKLFNEIMNNPNHKLKSLLPSAQGKIDGPFLRKQRYFNIPVIYLKAARSFCYNKQSFLSILYIQIAVILKFLSFLCH